MRLSGKGLIDRSQNLSFQFDGHTYRAHPGDTLASALLANDIHLVGRSFKYHRPRGILTAGSEEPNALVSVVRRRGAIDPNVRATVQEVYDGLTARSQNAWPSLSFDAMAINDLAAPFLGAGFYYKTFMWPRAFWEKLYEPVIRRAAGLGALSGERDEDPYEKAYAFCDLLVIGSGPAGLMAALTAAEAGADVILADEDHVMGGRLNAETHEVAGQASADWAADTIARLSKMDNVRLMPRTTVTGAYDQGTFGALERVTHHQNVPVDHACARETFWRIVAKRSVLAAGSIERPIAFQNNDRPGIMMASAVRTYLNRYGVAPGGAITLFANNDDAHRTAVDLQDAGADVVAVIDSRTDAKAQGDYRLIHGAQVCGASGRKALEAITVRTPKGEMAIKTDCLAVSGGWNPSVHLTCHMNGRPTWNSAIASFVPTPGAIPGMATVGACNGTFSTAACFAEGYAAAKDALKELGLTAPDMVLPDAEDSATRVSALWAVEGKGRAWLDFQNDVTVKDVKQAARENFRSVEHMKRYTTQGMATDQGKSSNVAALAVLADATGRGIPETGTTTFRPPYSPVALAALGAGAKGKGFAPERKTTSHAASTQDMDAPMIEAGLWYRPSYFPKSGERTWRQSCDREVGYVREAVGVCDVSTLGKIDIQGPDASKLLDFVYTNMFSTLKVGRVRYGLMLREDGNIMDDGTTARLGETHYVMTTTTAAAGPVMRHLEFVTQALHPEWDVRIMSVTEQWAQFAVAGPQSRALLNDLLDAPLAEGAFPFIACGPVQVHGIPARLFRISFSGEHAYELAVPSRYGDSLFRLLVARAEALGGGAYGMEALNVLRIEKGFITHSEIDGRVTAFDLGMERMISAKKDCIGKTMAARPGLVERDRQRFVGIKPVGEVKQLTAGAHIFLDGAFATAENSKGYITSVGYSPTLGHYVGLGFVEGGASREGEVMKMVDHLRGVEAQVEICDPVFFDPDGEKVRG
ncbi:MAG: sarcosine oxidase subunit alpha family protein [Rhodobacteraceae bacterium]|nr:sarcosine oxidase subunit alpha family protein [Paracoccaceae bacterium]